VDVNHGAQSIEPVPMFGDSLSSAPIPDYRSLLINFYNKHNPAKVTEVDSNLTKYKGKEADMFDKLSRKYRVANPLLLTTEAKTDVPSFLSSTSTITNVSPFRNAFSSPATTTNSPDYRSLLVDFYNKYNPSKVAEVDSNLAKYKGKETEMFMRLSSKYKVPNPLQAIIPSVASTNATFTNIRSPPSPFSSFGNNNNAPTDISSPFGPSQTTQPQFASATSAQSTSSLGPAPVPSFSTFGSSPSSNFGAAPKPSFGTPMTAPASPSPFRATAPASPSPFGAPTTPLKFGGKTPRELLTAFYQHTNPSKLSEVDKVLTKYSGQEEKLFRNLAQKYNVNPSVFGIPTQQPPGGSASQFGTTGGAATFGGNGFQANPTPQFGSPTPFGGPATTASGQFNPVPQFGSSGSGLGQSQMQFGQSTGFSAPSAGQSTGFGSSVPSSAAGFSSFASVGANNPSPFGANNPSPFGGARR